VLIRFCTKRGHQIEDQARIRHCRRLMAGHITSSWDSIEFWLRIPLEL
jgi:hypothetical protein